MAAKAKANPMSAMHTAGIFSDLSIDGPDIGTLVLIIDRAKNLPNRKTIGKQDPYCAARLGKIAKKTTTDIRGGQTPKWDQELRFRVNDSPDYYQLKLSVFNDDKKTDLIGETWIDLRAIIVPGGGQSDQWQSLNCKGKYAGEIRIEITYYDSRPKTEKAMSKGRPLASATASDSDLITASTGSQQPPPRRRPLPSNPGSEHNLPTTVGGPRPDVPTLPRAQSNPASFAPNQSPLSAGECQTPPRYPDHHSLASTRSAQSQFAVHPHRHDSGPRHHSAAEWEDEAAYDDEHSYHQDSYDRSYEPDPRSVYEQGNRGRPQFDPHPAAVHHARQSLPIREEDDRPPPPPAHRSLDGLQHQVTSSLPMRHDVLRSEAHRLSTSSVPNMSSHPTQSNYPGRPMYRPYDSAPDVPQEASLDESLDHSYNAAYESHNRSMQPTVEDVPECWTPPHARPRHRNPQADGYDVRYDDASSPAPPSMRGSTGSARYSPLAAEQSTDMVIRGHVHGHGHGHGNHAHSHSNSSRYDAYEGHRSEFDNPIAPGFDGYVPPSVPSTLVAGVDPNLAMEISNRIHQDTRRQRRYTQPTPSSNVGPRRGEAPGGYEVTPSPQAYYPGRGGGNSSMVYSGGSPGAGQGAVSPEASSPHHSIKRKSVSPAPQQDARLLSSVPYGPDSYDALNPSITCAEQEMPSPSEYTNAYGKIVTADGREIDPSDHLPMDTWAPEPEARPAKPQSAREASRPMPAGAQPMPPSGRRQLRISMKPRSGSAAPTTPDAPSPESLRNRLQKKVHRMSATAPYTPSKPTPLGPGTARYRNSTPPRISMHSGPSDYENADPPYGGNNQLVTRDAPPPIPAKVPISAQVSRPQRLPAPVHAPLMSGGLGPTVGMGGVGRNGIGGGDDWALMEEMSRIDLGNGRARRHDPY